MTNSKETYREEEDPQYLLNSVFTTLLTKIVNGEVDVKKLAEIELVNRGMDNTGKWIGFGKAKKHFNL